MIEIPASKRGNIVSDLMPDLTPLLDVMFMLIVFFILTANAVPYSLDVNLPEDNDAVTTTVSDPDMLSLTIMSDDQGWKINESIYKEEREFKKALKQHALDNKKVMIVDDKEASMQNFLTVMTFLRKHNIKTADIVMDKK